MNPTTANVLVVDDELNQRSALAGVISRWGYGVATASDGAEALEMLKSFDADVVITDLNMPNLDGKGLLEELQKSPTPPQTIVLTAFGNLETALETVHDLGAFWFLEKPIPPGALKMILERALAHGRLGQRADRLERELASRGVLGDLVGESAAMQEIFLLLQQAAPARATILITGESGTGKELAARAIHQLSPRRAEPFIAVNCAAMPETLIESELFGHEKGAFTGAVGRRAGCFELADGGTLLLDEIGDMPMGTQAKLLRVLEERRLRRLGSEREVELDVRVLASTNHDLREAIAKGTFREDLFFRLNVFEVHLPPLRERTADIPLIARTLISDLNQRHQCKVTDLAPDVMGVFQRYQWPGNARELRNVLERAVILTGSGTIGAAHLPRGFAGVVEPAARALDDRIALEAGMTIDEAEKLLIGITLRHTSGNRTRSAEILGISVKTLFNKLKEYGENE
ncbi:MAG: sigma-54-dependent Fis family transcriptional regulator [Bryobacterales bacterium]|nr:sigma-54-dependent Fis family transcriptional regulator [Bryobacterales bacterium]